MSYNNRLWSMVLLLFMLDTTTCVVRGMIIDAVTGQNVSLPCNVDQVNDQQTVKWWGHNGYISSGKIFTDILGATKPFYALPSDGTNYTLSIMIPDDISVWPYLADTYECRLVSSNDDDVYMELQIYELQIYQPECTIIHINGSTSVASCSYQNIQEFQVKWLIDGSSVHSMGDCTSDVCTLNYTYNPGEVNPQDIMCSITIGSMTILTCSIKQTHIATLPHGTEVSSPSTSLTKYTDTVNSQDTIIQSSPEGTVISSTITTAAIEEDNSTQIVIISVAALIILFLIIIILYFVRRNIKNKQNSAMKSPPTDENLNFENDQKEHAQKISMMGRPAQNDDINFKQSSEDSVMKENYIYQSADTNTYELTPTIDKDNVAKPIQAYVEIDDILDKKNMNKKSDGPTTLQTRNEVETSDDLGYMETENEAYQSLDDEFNERTGNAGKI